MKRVVNLKKSLTSSHQRRIGIVVAEFNRDITSSLAQGAQRALKASDVKDSQVAVFWVPGSVELPLAAAVCAETKKYDAIICLGAVIKGETDHYQYVCQMAADGIRKVSLQYQIPVMFGVLTCDTLAQAQERSHPDDSNTGYQVALAALRMVETLETIRIK